MQVICEARGASKEGFAHGTKVFVADLRRGSYDREEDLDSRWSNCRQKIRTLHVRGKIKLKIKFN